MPTFQIQKVFDKMCLANWIEWLKLIKSVQRLDGWARPEEKGRSVKLSGLLLNPLSDKTLSP